MSRNFELLQRLGMEQGLVEPLPLPPSLAVSASLPASEAAGAALADEVPVAVLDDYTQAMPVPDLAPAPELDLEGGERDEIARLVNKLFLIPNSDTARVVAIASAEPGDGGTWVTGYVAKYLAAHVSSPVCVVDGNLQSPGLHEVFGVARDGGLAEALVSLDPIRNYAKSAWRGNLSVVTAGHPAENWEALLSSDRMRSRIAELRAEFEYVIVDVPSLGEGSQGVILGRQVDGIVMVVRANSTRRDVARKAVDDLTESQVRILGAVLNQHTPMSGALFNRA